MIPVVLLSSISLEDGTCLARGRRVRRLPGEADRHRRVSGPGAPLLPAAASADAPSLAANPAVALNRSACWHRRRRSAQMPRSWLNVTASQPRRRNSMKRMIGVILAIAVAAGFAVVAQARPTAGGSPAGDRNHRSADVTFTKWVTSHLTDPSTAAGTCNGRGRRRRCRPRHVRRDGHHGRDDVEAGFWLGQALYGFYGSKHSFVAYNFITEDDGIRARSPPRSAASSSGDG